MTDARCSDLSRAADEPIGATATTARRWLLVEVGGGWPRDVSSSDALPDAARAAVESWLGTTPGSRLLFVRRPGRSVNQALAFVIDADEGEARVRRIELDGLDALADAVLDTDGEEVAGGLVLVCGHGSRDACCAVRGTAVYGALARGLGEEQLWLSSHQGGHRFAANVLVLPAGVQLGRVEPDDAPGVVARALAGTIELDHYRGRTFYPAAVQAAERAVREAAGLSGVDDLKLLDVDRARVRFRATDGRELAAVVEEVPGPTVPASCGDEPVSQKRLAATAA